MAWLRPIALCGVFAMLMFVVGCPPPMACDDNADCADGMFCNGAETCNAETMVCDAGASPCATGQTCDEAADTCETSCTVADCNDGLFCNGLEVCMGGQCVDGSSPCTTQEVCNEDEDICIPGPTPPRDPCEGIVCTDFDLCTNERCVDGKCQYPRVECLPAHTCKIGEGCVPADIDQQGTGPSFRTEPVDVFGGSIINKWTKLIIRYQLEGTESSLAADVLSNLYADAAAEWSQHIPLDILQAQAGDDVDIVVHFCPSDRVELSCAALRDEDTNFDGSANRPNGDQQVYQLLAVPQDLDDPAITNALFAVILHEFGHNLGLDHSQVEEAIMYKSISGDIATIERVQLQADDIDRIQNLYGDRAGTQEPLVPTFPDIPTNPDTVTPPLPNGPDSDGDGLADSFEDLVTSTDPTEMDTDGDGLSDAFEFEFGLNPNSPDSDGDGRFDRDEIIEGTPARAPVICRAPDEFFDQRVLLMAARNFDDLGFEDGELVQSSNLRNGCQADGVTIRRAEDDDSGCSIRIPRNLREALCVFQLNAAVPLEICNLTAPITLVDFDGPIQPPATDGRGTLPRLVTRDGLQALQVDWALDGFSDFRFVVLFSQQPRLVNTGLRLVVDVEVAQQQVLEIGAKTGPPGDSIRRDFGVFLLAPSRRHTVSIEITNQYELTEIDFVIQGFRNCDPVVSTDCQPPAGTFWVSRIRLDGIPQILFDFETGIDPPIVVGRTPNDETGVIRRPQNSENDVFQFSWSLDAAPADADSFVVLVFDGISVGPCDRLLADLEVAEAQTVRFEVKNTDAAVQDTRSREMRPGNVEEIEISISGRYALGEIAFVIERELNEDTSRTGILWIDNIRLVRGD